MQIISRRTLLWKRNSEVEYRRHVGNKTILREKRISRSVYGFDWYHNNGQYSKGKIHCGCGVCKFGKKYGLPTISDMRENITCLF